MSEQNTFDPLKMWKEFYDQNEKYWDDFITEKMRTEDFSQFLGKVLEMNMYYKDMMNKTSERTLEEMNMPTKNDIANVASLVINLEAKVDNLEDFIDESSSKQVNQSSMKREITRLKNDMSQLDEKLDHVIDHLSKLSAPSQKTASDKTNE